MDDDSIDTNIAATLRDIAANCDKTTGKVLALCNKAAQDGRNNIIVKVSPEDREYLFCREHGWRLPTITPLVEKLESLGFKLKATERATFWSNSRRFIIVSW